VMCQWRLDLLRLNWKAWCHAKAR